MERVYLEARPPKDVDRGSRPRDLFVEILAPFPRLIAGNKSRYVDDLAAVAEIDHLLISATARVRVSVRDFDESNPRTHGEIKAEIFLQSRKI